LSQFVDEGFKVRIIHRNSVGEVLEVRGQSIINSISTRRPGLENALTRLRYQEDHRGFSLADEDRTKRTMEIVHYVKTDPHVYAFYKIHNTITFPC